ncbi:polysaccharide deacetylase family protein [Cellulomonas chengniuliangii]|uniref:Polysaccharide deacetylase family protein n=1 Tax=Cellulomonas chengniuliangii TaxID=2968084 RepID=A0ABY5L061_9CELL|nr:polysaccharide deacetylase family protein [Cellulomonas chengniuliangii]MCC2307118.1 polysaccharide deacetylase family protein [Cellulomonas chengniuliangii]UUI76084.1 polysaccharide deacetylase family protein [Cellulomonas chengniuliangii]
MRPDDDVLVLRRDLGHFGSPRVPGRRAVLQPVAWMVRPLTCTVAVATTGRVAALTFDDGPSPAHTPALLDVLAERRVRATFFVLATAAQAHPGLVRRIVADGHELALHGWDHRRLGGLPTGEAVGRVAAARDEVEQLSGVRVRLFRPPYGAHTPAQLRGWSRLGLDVVLWSGWAEDWRHDEEEAVAARAIAALTPGGILLLHDVRGDPETAGPDEELPHFDRADVLRRLLDGAPDYTFQTVGELVAAHPRIRMVLRDLMG